MITSSDFDRHVGPTLTLAVGGADEWFTTVKTLAQSTGAPVVASYTETVEPGDTVRLDALSKTLYGKASFLIEFPITAWGDYVGSDIARANFRYLTETHPDTFVTSFDAFGAEELFVIIGHVPDGYTTEDWHTTLRTYAERLEDYPILCESTWGEVEQEIIGESYDFILSDIVRDVEELLGGADIGSEGVEIITDHYNTHSEWSCESATSAVNHAHNECVRHVAQKIDPAGNHCQCWDCTASQAPLF